MLFASIVLAVGIAFYFWLKDYYSFWEKRNVPHEKPSLFVGNMKGLGRFHHWKEINERVYNKFKNATPVAGFFTFATRAVLLLDLDLIKDIMVKEFNSFTDRNLYHNEKDEPLTANLAYLDGDKWQALRQKVTPVFAAAKINSLVPTMTSVAQNLEGACLKSMAGHRGLMEIKQLCARYIADVIGTSAFGIECNSLTDPDAEFYKTGCSIFENPRQSAFVKLLMYTNPELARKLQLKCLNDDVNEFFLNAVRKTVESRIKNKVKRNDIIDMLIEMKVKRDELLAQGKSVDENDLASGLTLEQVAAQATTFFLTGFDSSASIMSYCLYELGLNHDIQNKVRKEMNDVLKKHKNQLTYECLKDMQYLDMVLSEILRKYSVSPQLVRTCVKEYKVPNTNVVIEKGMRVIIPLDCIHRDPEYYPDPAKFIPERFTPDAVKSRHPFAYLPFGEGPRNCIAMNFAKLLVQVGLVTLLTKFRFNRVIQTQVPLTFSKVHFALKPDYGVYLRVETL